MLKFLPVYTALLIVLGFKTQAQKDFYSPSHISEIRLYFSKPGWQHQLDSIFMASGGTVRMMADISIDGHFCKNVGVRYKGFSSWIPGEIKNPFNIELDYTIRNQNHLGFTRLKLSNVIHDPSFIREVLAYEIVRKYMPASRASYARLFVNDTLIGLYSNVESVDKIFISRYYPSAKNVFIKGDPAELLFPFGQNANLAHTHGNDTLNYVPYYKLESDFGWKDLYDFIYILNESPDSIENVLNTDRTLWMHALNYTLLNLDSYIGFAQNYYIYKDDIGRFNPIIWDLNMSFGSFRSSDGSTHFQGLTIDQMKILDPLQHLNFSISPRPLMTNLFRNNTYKKMFLAHIRTILDENIRNDWYYHRGLELMQTIRSDVQADTNKFYSDADFENNISQTVGGTSGMLEYPGLKDIMTARLEYLDAYPGIPGSPHITEVVAFPAITGKGEYCRITAKSGGDRVILAYRCTTRAAFIKTEMFDDGAHQDGQPGDSVFGASVFVNGNIFQYYLYAENDSAGRFSPERAEYEYYSVRVRPEKGEVCINELATADGTTGTWLELLNNTNEVKALAGCYMSTDAEGLNRWNFPDTTILPHSFLIVHLGSADTSGMSCHLPVSTLAGLYILFNNKGQKMDHVSYPLQHTNKTYGRYPNGFGPFVYMQPTYSRNNYSGSFPSVGFRVYPSPAQSEVFIELPGGTQPYSLEVINIQGQKVTGVSNTGITNASGSILHRIDISNWADGVYIIQLNRDGIRSEKFVKSNPNPR